MTRKWDGEQYSPKADQRRRGCTEGGEKVHGGCNEGIMVQI